MNNFNEEKANAEKAMKLGLTNEQYKFAEQSILSFINNTNALNDCLKEYDNYKKKHSILHKLKKIFKKTYDRKDDD